RVRERKGRAPRSAEHEPALDSEVRAQALEVGDEMLRRVVAKLAQRRRLARTALIVEHDAIARRIEVAAMVRRDAAAGATVKEYCRNPARVAALLPVHRMHRVEREPPCALRNYGRIKDIIARERPGRTEARHSRCGSHRSHGT